nr:SART-1 family protein DOT2-like [Ipomoea batatas]
MGDGEMRSKAAYTKAQEASKALRPEQEVFDDDDNEEFRKSLVTEEDAIHEAPVGKGLCTALRLLKQRGAFKETIEWGGRNTDNKKSSKLLDKEIHIERTDEYGRILTPKEAFRLFSHKFHGKRPCKRKQEKRMRQYQQHLKVKQMTPSQSVERLREAQKKLNTPYLILS